MSIELIDEAVSSGARLFRACEILGLSKRTVKRWRGSPTVGDLRAGPKTVPANKLSQTARARILKVVNLPAYRDSSPKVIVPKLADNGEYMCSESTVYRILREDKALTHRSSARNRQKRHKPDEYCASGPGQVMSWDITYLPATVRGHFFYLYLILDVWSRKIVGWEVHESESMEFASELISQVAHDEGLVAKAAVLHADNGGPMKGATMLATLERLGVAASFSRPRVSNDNPFSESLFGTFKGRPGYPQRRFDSIYEAQAWVNQFVAWYNHQHLHSAIGFVTPADRHAGRDIAILAARRDVYAKARAKNPNRWSQHHRAWHRPESVFLNPDKTTLNRMKKDRAST